jgi:hypothetical protein
VAETCRDDVSDYVGSADDGRRLPTPSVVLKGNCDTHLGSYNTFRRFNSLRL